MADDEKLSTGGFEVLPSDEFLMNAGLVNLPDDEYDDKHAKEWEEYLAFKAAHRVSIPGPTFEQLATKEDVRSALNSLAKLAAQAKRQATATEKQAKHLKGIELALQRSLEERKVTNRAMWQAVGELKLIAKRIKPL